MFVNTIIFYALSAVALIVASIFIIWQDKNKPLTALLMKLAASFCFLALGIIGNFFNVDASLSCALIAVGFAASIIGDGVLEGVYFPSLNKDNVIKCGMVSFGIAQLLFFVSLVLFSGFSWIAIAFGVVVAVVILFSEKPLKLNYRTTKPFTVGYSLLLGMTVGQAIMTAISLNFSFVSILLLVGFVLFFASDLVLSMIYFSDKEKPALRYVNLALYYLAQIIVAFSIFYM